MKNKVIIVIVIFLAGVASGRYSKPSEIKIKEVIKTEIKFKEKIVEVNTTKKNQVENITETITISKDGSKTISRQITKSNKDEIINSSSKISNSTSKTEKKRSKKVKNNSLNLSIYTNIENIDDLRSPNYGVLVQKEVFLNFNAGVGLNTNKSLLISIGYNF